jgi:hypothetical protein
MELFIPSLVVLVLGAIVVFFILPKMSPQILGFTSIVLLCIGLYQHTMTFPYEYRLSNFTDMLKDYAPFVMIGATILGLSIAIMVMVPGSTSDSISSALPALPALPALAALPAMPALAMPDLSMPSMPSFPMSPNANVRKNSPNAPKNNSLKRNNIASTSYKVT